jgi:ribose/xylose/arabinose/galactoside ABC-type transport system permease subunit
LADTIYTPTPQGPGGAARALQFLSRAWSYLFLLALIIFFSLASESFRSVESMMNIFTATSPVLLLALGQTFVIISSGIDLSVGWTMGFASVVSALVMRSLFDNGTAEPIAILLGIVIGIAVTAIPGLINGILIARVKVPAFIATLGMFSIMRGVSLLFSGGNTVASLPPNLSLLGNGNLVYVVKGQLAFFQQPDGLAREDLRAMTRLLPYPDGTPTPSAAICRRPYAQASPS